LAYHRRGAPQNACDVGVVALTQNAQLDRPALDIREPAQRPQQRAVVDHLLHSPQRETIGSIGSIATRRRARSSTCAERQACRNSFNAIANSQDRPEPVSAR
jgi:hypothetical protein